MEKKKGGPTNEDQAIGWFYYHLCSILRDGPAGNKEDIEELLTKYDKQEVDDMVRYFLVLDKPEKYIELSRHLAEDFPYIMEEYSRHARIQKLINPD